MALLKQVIQSLNASLHGLFIILAVMVFAGLALSMMLPKTSDLLKNEYGPGNEKFDEKARNGFNSIRLPKHLKAKPKN